MEGYMKYVGWDQTLKSNQNMQILMHPDNIRRYQAKITHLLKGVHPEGRPIVVPEDTIQHVLFKCYEAHRPSVGDMYSRYVQMREQDDMTKIVNETIHLIVSQIKTEYATVEQNKKLTIWTSLYGDFNAHGLRSHPPIKIRQNGRRMQFHMNY